MLAKYSTGIKPKIRDHYHSHRLSFWLNLIPKLEKQGKEESDHLKRHLQDQGVPSFEKISLSFLSSLQTPKNVDNSMGNPINQANEADLSTGNSNNNRNAISNHEEDTINSSLSLHTIIGNKNLYSTALSLTISMGIILLIVNGFIFAGVYYYLNKRKSKISKSNANDDIKYVNNISKQETSKMDSYSTYCCENHHICPFNDANVANNISTCNLINTDHHQQASNDQQNVNNDDGKQCQCSACHQANVCDNEHCITVIHEFDEHFL